MAFLDFLTQRPMGGAQAPTYGQLLGTAMQYGSKPGSSGPAFAPLAAGQAGVINPQGMLQLGQQGPKKADSTSLITTLLGIFGL